MYSTFHGFVKPSTVWLNTFWNISTQNCHMPFNGFIDELYCFTFFHRTSGIGYLDHLESGLICNPPPPSPNPNGGAKIINYWVDRY